MGWMSECVTLCHGVFLGRYSDTGEAPFRASRSFQLFIGTPHPTFSKIAYNYFKNNAHRANCRVVCQRGLSFLLFLQEPRSRNHEPMLKLAHSKMIASGGNLL